MINKPILWIEDNPNFLNRFTRQFKIMKHKITLNELLNKITFAYDIQSALKQLQSYEYNLVISSTNFPNQMPQERKTILDNYLQNIPTNQKLTFEFWGNSEFRKHNLGNPIIEFNFLNLYFTYLQKTRIQPKLILYTSNHKMLKIGFLLGIPVFSKTSPISTVKQLLKNNKKIYTLIPTKYKQKIKHIAQNRFGKEITLTAILESEIGGTIELLKKIYPYI